jgi:hypothetical protein
MCGIKIPRIGGDIYAVWYSYDGVGECGRCEKAAFPKDKDEPKMVRPKKVLAKIVGWSRVTTTR